MQNQRRQQLAADIVALAREEERLQAMLLDRRAAQQAELQELSAALEALRQQAHRLHQQQLQAFLQQWAGHLDRHPLPTDYFWLFEGRSRESVLLERAQIDQFRDRNLQDIEDRYTRSREDCGRRWQRDKAQLLGQLQAAQRNRELLSQQYNALLG
jgi:hypothetical protein